MPDDAQAPTRAQRLNRLGIPAAETPEPRWSADLFAPTTTDLGAGNPRNGISPWPTADRRP